MKIGIYLVSVFATIGGLALTCIAVLSVIEGEIRGLLALPFYLLGTIGMGLLAVRTYRLEFPKVVGEEAKNE